MGCRILVGMHDDGACFYDSVTDTVFGHLMEDQEEAESFMEWLEVDPRALGNNEIEAELIKFRSERETQNAVI